MVKFNIIWISIILILSSCTPSVLREYKQAKRAVARSDNSFHIKTSPKRWSFLASDQDTKQVMSLIEKLDVVVLYEKEAVSEFTKKRVDRFSESVKKISSEPLITLMSEGNHVRIFEMPFKKDWIMCLVDTEEAFIIAEAKIKIQDIIQLANTPELLSEFAD